MPKDQRDEVALILVLAIIGIALIWTYVIQPLITWIQINLFWIGVVLIAIIGFISFGVYENNKEQKRLESIRKIEQERIESERQKEKEKLEEEKRIFYESQKSKGLFLFRNRHSEEKWGSQRDINKWRKEEELEILKETTYYKVIESIKLFQPSRVYKNELPYHTELQGWLKHDFPDSKIEKQRGPARPDIVIGNIAIEVKGPTDNRALDSLFKKCVIYSQRYDSLIFVLFEPSYSEKLYQETVNGLKKYFPNVEIITK